jgi:hypothetical protein
VPFLLRVAKLSIIMLCVLMRRAVTCYIECSDVCHIAEGHYAECC